MSRSKFPPSSPLKPSTRCRQSLPKASVEERSGIRVRTNNVYVSVDVCCCRELGFALASPEGTVDSHIAISTIVSTCSAPATAAVRMSFELRYFVSLLFFSFFSLLMAAWETRTVWFFLRSQSQRM